MINTGTLVWNLSAASTTLVIMVEVDETISTPRFFASSFTVLMHVLRNCGTWDG